MSLNLNDKAMLVSLNLRKWSARKYDKGVSDEVAQRYGANSDSGRYNKVLIARDYLKAIEKIDNEIRTYHYKVTLPWTNDGLQIMPAAVYLEYLEKMRDFKSKRETAVNVLLMNYSSLVAQARVELNGLFNPADYPQDISRTFGFDVNFFPMPESKDFRVDLSDSEVQRLKDELDANLKSTETMVVQEVWKRLHEVVSRMVARLSEPKAIFRDTLIFNTAELVGLLPKLNITGDTALSNMGKEIEAKLLRYAPQELRESKRARKDVAKEADEILKKMDGCF